MGVDKSISRSGRDTITRWEPFQPVPGLTTGVATQEGAWRKVGENAEIYVGYIFNGGGGATLNWLTLPNGWNISFNKMGLPTMAASTRAVGWGVWQDAGVGWRGMRPNPLTGTTIGLWPEDTSPASGTNMNAMASTDQMMFFISVPIEGW